MDGKLIFIIEQSFTQSAFEINVTSLLIAVEVINKGYPLTLNYVGFQIDSSKIFTDETWKCTYDTPPSKEWIQPNFNDSNWSNAVCYVTEDRPGDLLKLYMNKYTPYTGSKKPCFISTSLSPNFFRLYCRKYLALNTSDGHSFNV